MACAGAEVQCGMSDSAPFLCDDLENCNDVTFLKANLRCDGIFVL